MKKIHAKQALTETGWEPDITVSVDGKGRITDVGAGPAKGSEQKSGSVDLLLPAPVNLHSHSFQRAMAGLTETQGRDRQDNFWSWRRLMYRFLDRLTPEHIEAIAALAFMEMLEAGYAAVAEFHYLHHAADGTPYDDIAQMAGRIVAAAEATGIGLTLLPVLYTYGGCDSRPLADGQRRFGNDIGQFARLHEASTALINNAREDFTTGIAPHSLRAVDPESLGEAVRLGGGEVPIHIHLAEQTAEVDEVLAHHKARPAEWLLANHDVDARWCLIHCTQMTKRETGSLAGTGAVAGLCPITESNLGDGIFNGTLFAASGGRFGVGSDSNIHIALFEELAALEYSQRLRDHSRAALASPDRSTGRVLFDTVSKSGALAANRASGSIAVGNRADLIGIATENPWLCHRNGDALLDGLVFSGRGRECITDVWSSGHHVVREGRHFARDTIVSGFMDVINRLGQEI